MRLVDCEQGTDEWLAARCGKATASRVADIIAETKSGPSAMRTNYHAELVAERLTGTPASKFTNGAMQWGTDTEPEARQVYAMTHAVEVVEVGLVIHPTIDMSAASPDGLVGDDGMVEIKCPNTATHIATLLDQKVPAKYATQMQWQMACTGRTWSDFVSYDPRMPGNMSMFVQRVERDDAVIDDLTAEVVRFLADVDKTVAELTARYGLESAA